MAGEHRESGEKERPRTDAHAPGSCAGAASSASAPAGTTGRQGRRWQPGEAILWRYRANTRHAPGCTDTTAGFHICRPVRVVQDTEELLAVWLAPGTACIKPALADGTPLHHAPLATRYTGARTTVRTRWRGTGVLKLARPGDPWSVWLFWDPGWRFRNYYVNLETPHTRWAEGVDSEDHFLDLSVDNDGTVALLDEDEFEAARRAGLMSSAHAAQVRRSVRAARRAIASWEPPFCAGWDRWRPEPHWSIPELPADWDRAPLSGEAGDTGSAAPQPSAGGTVLGEVDAQSAAQGALERGSS